MGVRSALESGSNVEKRSFDFDGKLTQMYGSTLAVEVEPRKLEDTMIDERGR